MLTFHQITLKRGVKCLLEQASVTLHEKQKIGLVGKNGCGKTSLFSLITKELDAEQGELLFNKQLVISHLSQQLPNSAEAAIDFVLAGDTAYRQLMQRLQQAEKRGDDAEVIACHDKLAQMNAYSKPALAASILAGLGFKSEAQQAPVNELSGGWRMRLNLARCLLTPADLLLLDEPTNHLDLEAIVWLEKWLEQVVHTVILISHDRDFLDAFATHILHIDQGQLTLYKGTYSRFEQARAQQLMLQQAQHEKQQRQLQHMMSYVERFRAKPSKARQAQSRLKAIEKMEVIASAQLDSPFSFAFFPCPRAKAPLIRCQQLSAGYLSGQLILKDVNLVINPGSRIALIGPNGQGKSTLIKTLIGHLKPLKGNIEYATHLKVGYFAQHQLEQLDEQLSPLQTIQAISPQATEHEIRSFLGGFNIIGDMAIQPIGPFSGGEKARLVLAQLVWSKPNVLLLDEPTNHLDLNMRLAVEMALQSYEGALILITHDRHFLRTTVDELFLVYQQQVRVFDGSIEDYYQWVQKQNALSDKKAVADSADNYREKRQLHNRLKTLEQQIAVQGKKKAAIEQTLADATLYEAPMQKALEQALKERHTIEKQLNDMEEEWLGIVSKLEDY